MLVARVNQQLEAFITKCGEQFLKRRAFSATIENRLTFRIPMSEIESPRADGQSKVALRVCECGLAHTPPARTSSTRFAALAVNT